MALLQSTPVSVTTDVFQEGDIRYKSFPFPDKSKKSTSTTPSPPKPLLIFTPTVPGLYPVILFCHGFCLRNSFYEKLLGHIASHGFTVVAPQFYEPLCYMLGIVEVKCAGNVADWIAQNLQSVLPGNVKANLEQFVIAGHSRGGKIAFAVALGHAQNKLKPSVLIGIDPVEGFSNCKLGRTFPHILTYVPRSLNLGMPVAVIGTGLGPEKKNIFSKPCAPQGLNHKEFYNECKPPCAYFVTKDYGHMDMLDDNPPSMVGKMSSCMCKNGTGPRDFMRRTVGGLVVAFLRAYLNDQREDLEAIVMNNSIAPATLDPVDYLPA
ncbi:hypothetical protein L6164_034517 [Bauhinia variegata]|uniref:Uncharacterized protein n=1 Tax=Bauhinia variegata TaxID=167791 RepID=A0ACB9KV57_BAUVA|nr:hypothetical protein L6164_034517 [Bauhinia variegata]